MRALVFLLVLLHLATAGDTDLSRVEAYIHQRLNITTVSPAPMGTCGFEDQLNLRTHFSQLPAHLQRLAKQLIVKPVRQDSMLSPKGHFMLHYDTLGYHAVPLADQSGNGIPDYVDSAAVYLEHAWDVEINELGFHPPPDAHGRPIDHYPVYFTNFGFYGVTNFDLKDDILELPGNNYPSYLELNNDFYNTGFYTTGLAAMKVTCAHEFNHAIQLGYNFRVVNYGYPDVFFMEMTSTWLEDFVYNSVNDYYQYLTNFFPHIDRYPFNQADGNSEYANSIYLHMLAKLYGPKIVPAIWQKINDYPAVDAINAALMQKGSNFALSQNRYAVWVYFTGNRADPQKFFTEGAQYPQIYLNSDMDNLTQSLTQLHMRHGKTYVDKNYIYAAKISASSNNGYCNHINNGQANHGPVSFNQTQIFNQRPDVPLIIVLTNPTQESINDITYSLNLAPLGVGSNPMRVKNKGDKITFYNMPPRSVLSVFTVNGRLVSRIRNDQNDVQNIEWDLRDRLGGTLHSGVYLYYLKSGDGSYPGKFTLVR